MQPIQDILHALEAHGFVLINQDRYTLSPGLALLDSPTAIQSLAGVLRAASVKIKTIRDAGATENIYTTMPAEDVLSMATGIGTSSLSPAAHFSIALMAEAMPELKERWQSGARHLEVGCGIGNNLLGIAITFPETCLVGLEIEALTAREAQRRTDLLGLGDRVEVRHMDACELEEEAVYDTAQWSQFFFPNESRGKVLEALRCALKPGGLVFMPMLTVVPANGRDRRKAMFRTALHALFSNPTLAMPFMNDLIGDNPRRQEKENRFRALQRLLYGRWGVPVCSADELRTEMEKVGFQVLREIPVPASPFSESRGQLLARRPVG